MTIKLFLNLFKLTCTYLTLLNSATIFKNAVVVGMHVGILYRGLLSTASRLRISSLDNPEKTEEEEEMGALPSLLKRLQNCFKTLATTWKSQLIKFGWRIQY
jgi:hypothetical protein